MSLGKMFFEETPYFSSQGVARIVKSNRVELEHSGDPLLVALGNCLVVARHYVAIDLNRLIKPGAR